MPFATGKLAWAICDRCGLRCRYLELNDDVVNQRKTGLRVCPACVDQDNPQLWVSRSLRAEGIALRNPRPDTGLDDSTGTFGWNPVSSLNFPINVGAVRVLVA